MHGSLKVKTEIGKYASYIYVKEWDDSFKPLKTKQLADSVILDYSKDGELIGIEILATLKPEFDNEG
jgi:uncharacterized protein YuzE